MELADIQRSSDLSLAVACRDVDVRNVKAIIIGPSDSPYEFGFFEFAVKFGKGMTRARTIYRGQWQLNFSQIILERHLLYNQLRQMEAGADSIRIYMLKEKSVCE
ncbi:hypothetical protein M7I_3491 [Glarea lozoyensis 74030]|uniref:Uncharacterized protein n=1 Tax=Glarea lozoyensis (strain ATCC 74030 / MF5533) TaxID=1104152 RepID=H0ELM5_GLAL7|nr:hypothetical protein M7I_3491 [Glarea lozoyensis 74030]